jgi:hypothetical protein
MASRVRADAFVRPAKAKPSGGDVSFSEKMGTPSPRSSGIIELADNLEVIYGAQ